MLLRLVGLIILGILGAALASWLAAQPGTLQFDWFGWRLEMPTSLAVAVVIILALILLFLDRLIRNILRLPAWIGQTVEQRRDASGHKALTLGLMAVSAGEAREARKQAARAQRLMQAPQLTDLLSAQAAHLAGDHQAASRYFKSLTKDKDTAFLGHIGLARLEIEANDKAAALSSARLAFALKPKSVMAAQQVSMLEADAGNWQAAANATELLLADAADSGKELGNVQRQKTSLYYLMADDGLKNDDKHAAVPKGVNKALETALASDSGFLPAVLALADIHFASGAKRKAIKVLETGFKTNPTMDIADRLLAAWNLNEGAYIARLIKLVGTVKADEETRATAHYIAAAKAFEFGLDGESKGQLEEISDRNRDTNMWRLVAQIANQEEDQVAAAAALHRASDAPRGHSWQCVNCHSLSSDWGSHCSDCGSFGTLNWCRPRHVTPLAKIADDKISHQIKIDNA